jgi:hypothetical protein
MGTHGGQIRSISGTLIGRRLLGTLGGVEGRNKPLNNPKKTHFNCPHPTKERTGGYLPVCFMKPSGCLRFLK